MAFFDNLIKWFKQTATGLIYLPSGETVTFPGTPETALRLSAVFACSRLIAETIATLPLEMMEAVGRGKRAAISDPRYFLVHDQPNGFTDALTWIDITIMSALHRGNAYAHILRDQSGQPISITPLDPLKVKVGLADGEKLYIYNPTEGGGGDGITIPGSDMLHVMGMSPNGIHGVSIIEYARNAIELAMQQEAFGLSSYRNSPYNNLMIKSQGKISADDKKQLRQDFEQLHAGANNSGRPMIFDQNMTAEKLSLTPEDAQWVAGRNLSTEEICRYYRVPLHLVQSSQGKQSYSSNESNNDAFRTFTLLPWIKKIESQLNSKLLLPSERGKYSFEFDFSGLLRANMLARYQSYQIGIQSGFLTKNEVRNWESMESLPGGDALQQSLNMAPADNSDGNDSNKTNEQEGSNEPAATK